MYLFTRGIRALTSDIPGVMQWSVGITERVRQTTGMQVSLHQSMFSPAVGSLVWSMVVPDLLALETAFDKLATDEGYLAEAARGAGFAPGGADDTLAMLLHPQAVDADRAGRLASAEYAVVVRSICAPGQATRAMALGVQLAERAEKLSGGDAAFLADATGTYGGVAWITSFHDIGAMEAGNVALGTDEEFQRIVDQEASAVFASDVSATMQSIYRRIL